MNPELLLPVGNMSMCLAAIHGGADAVYIGVPYFNARGRTTDFPLKELKEMIDLCHLYGVRVNLASNIVIFQNELPKVVEIFSEVLKMGPDAFIVQDLGLAQMIRAIAPKQRIHASTQMTVTNADAIKLVDDLKIDRFVLGRENSLDEIRKIRENTDKELEVFVHGALCVSYSGQCFTSESLGGRSANRGQCAQSCRLPYELYVDDEKRDFGDRQYFVSPKDLMGIAEVPELKKIGIDSYKIEGRLKTPEYVSAAAKNYREVLDGAPLDLERRTQELATTYSRGFFSGWLNGVNHQELVDGTYSANRGLEVGVIKEFNRKGLPLIESTRELKAGMGLLFVDGKEEQGSKIFLAEKVKGYFEVKLLQKNIKLKEGMKVYLNSDEAQTKELQKTWSSREHMKRIPLRFNVTAKLGEKLHIEAIDPEGRKAEIYSENNLSPASNRPVTEDFFKDELSSLGMTVYTLNSFNATIDQNLFFNHKELKELRRELISKMSAIRVDRSQDIFETSIPTVITNQKASNYGLNILLRSRAQVEGFIQHFSQFESLKHLIKSVILDFEFGKDYAPSIEMLKSIGVRAGIATTRILKPDEYYNLNIIMRCKPDLVLVRNLGAFHYLKEKSSIPLIGDFSLNVTNSLTHSYLINKGLETVNVSYDLNQDQLLDLVDKSDSSKVEVTLHQYMPEFHMEHCVFAAFLSKGTSFKDCGKPCEKHEVKLKDPYGNMHFLKPDQECRNTFFKATPQSASFLIGQLKAKGVETYRLEALNEDVTKINMKIMTYLELLDERITSEEAMKRLQMAESYGLGMGQINKADNYKARKKEHSLTK
jgi:putative protease